MNGIQDMGGVHGFGRVEREADEPVFHEPWEGRVSAMRRLMAKRAGGRPTIERLDPLVYLASSYYEKWLRGAEAGLIASGALTRQELDERTARFRERPETPVPRRDDPALARRVRETINVLPFPHRDTGATPRFKVGDAVRARNLHPAGHTRLPRYARGKVGVVFAYHGIHDIDDEDPPDGRGAPQPVYAVRFAGRELCGAGAEPGSFVHIDMWESYLEAP